MYDIIILSTFNRSIKWSSGALPSYSSNLVTAKTTAADVSLPPRTIRSSHPNRFLMESIRSTTRRPLELSTDSVALEAVVGDSGPAWSIFWHCHDSAIKQRRKPLHRTFHTFLLSWAENRTSASDCSSSLI